LEDHERETLIQENKKIAPSPLPDASPSSLRPARVRADDTELEPRGVGVGSVI